MVATHQEHGLLISENTIFVPSSESGVHVIIPYNSQHHITSCGCVINLRVWFWNEHLHLISLPKSFWESLTWVEWTYMIPPGPPYWWCDLEQGVPTHNKTHIVLQSLWKQLQQMHRFPGWTIPWVCEAQVNEGSWLRREKWIQRVQKTNKFIGLLRYLVTSACWSPWITLLVLLLTTKGCFFLVRSIQRVTVQSSQPVEQKSSHAMVKKGK